MKKRLIIADDMHEASAKILEIRQSATDLLDVYKKLFEDLNDLYNGYPNLYQEIQRVVKLPTNEDANDVTTFYKDLLQELELLKNPENLQKVLDGNSLDAPEGNGDEE